MIQIPAILLSIVVAALSRADNLPVATTQAEANRRTQEQSRPSRHPFASADATLRALHESVRSSVVTVTAYEPVPEGIAYEGRWAIADESPYPGFARMTVASGFVASADGTVLCCYTPLTFPNGSLVERVDVEAADGSRFAAELLAVEPTIDLAVLRLKPMSDGSFGSLTPIVPGSVDKLEVGDAVFAVADPFGSARTFAPGIVMALPTAACYQADLTGSFVHASMAIAPGAVGGILVNGAGQTVGMLVPYPSGDPTVRAQPQPFVTLAMQLQTALGVAEALKTKRSKDSPWVGFSVMSAAELRRKVSDQRAFDALKQPAHGLYIDDLYEPSPAAAAGVKVGDWVMTMNTTAIHSVVDFQQSLYYFAGSQVPARIFRDGNEMTVMLKIEKRPAEANRTR
jgi:S1-C subfamily serine protease